MTPIASLALETGLADLRDPSYFVWTATVSYEPSGDDDETGTLTGKIDQSVGSLTFSVSTPVDWQNVGIAEFDPTTDAYLGRRLHFGFSAANGLADDGHFVQALTPVPEPGLGAMVIAGTGLLAAPARRRTRRGDA